MFSIFLILGLSIFNSIYSNPKDYPWIDNEIYKNSEKIISIPVPKNFERITIGAGLKHTPTINSFENWLRNLPLKKDHPFVFLYNGKKKKYQDAQYKIIDIDVGAQDLQQCADAIIRLRAEYLYSINEYSNLHFNFTNNDTAYYEKWREGFRPSFNKNKSNWIKTKSTDSSYYSFKEYLNVIFNYAGSYSLNKEMIKVKNIEDMKIGDVFIQGGFPGHAIIVVDLAINPKNNNKIFMIAQSYMPAQEIHILKNPNNENLSPWYELNFGNILLTPEWDFLKTDLKRWK